MTFLSYSMKIRNKKKIPYLFSNDTTHVLLSFLEDTTKSQKSFSVQSLYKIMTKIKLHHISCSILSSIAVRCFRNISGNTHQ